ncbi:hypothetical protein [Cellulomonas shaoxiangyii]|uniref:Alkaline phosphatase family protein n=1 Tax=Cellulomonas shaoxiangyii TaxID=2566013 RepID=A0A4P7SE59_9CELL|nr:hypothetical protein [Cellulomonas shaoxiangyii]QCB92409.1 hypothetical protein E5225_01420 [Cellulomonas shaoxiangyii]TGY85612.1 hypothetical protein E5226_05525 [Cellulomonas shaoxiangyii]
MPRSLRAVVPVLLAVLTAVLGVGVVAPAAAAPGPAASALETPVPGPVVLVGVTGLRWDDVGSLTTPALWELSRDGSVGAVAARSVATRSCPADGWLAVSAGARAADLTVDDRTCRSLRAPGEDGTVPGWDDFLASANAESYGARPGTLGRILAEAGATAVGIGPGAAIALADPRGVPVGEHVRSPTSTTALGRLVRDAAGADLLVVDAGQIRDPGYGTAPRLPSADPSGNPATGEEDEDEVPLGDAPEGSDLPGSESIVEPSRAQQAVTVDARVGAVLDALAGRDATVLVVSLADSGRVALQVAAAVGPRETEPAFGESLLTSGSTRQAGVVQTTDVTPTLLALLGLLDDAPALPGAEIRPVPGPATGGARVAALLDAQQEASAVTRVSGSFSARLVLAQAALFLAAAVVLTRRGRADGRALSPALRVLQVAALALGAAPVASFLVGLVPWWRSDRPVTAFWWTLLGIIAVVTAAALAGPWRRHVLGPAGVVAGVTVVTLVVDALVGSPLVIDAPMGAQRIMAARFYGMSNQAFALITAAGVLVAVVVADALLRAGRRRAAVAFVVLLGLVLAVVDGAPQWGADFGGPVAILVAFAMLAVAVSGRRVSWKVVLLVGVVGGALVLGFAFLDWLRAPADRTHLGRFFATVLDGGLWDVVWRKLSVNLRVLASWRYLVLAIGGVALTWLVLAGPRPRRGALMGEGSPLAGLQSAVPLLRPAVAASGVALTIGFLMNDSGIVVLATGIAVAVPCLVAAAAQWRLAHPADDAPGVGPGPGTDATDGAHAHGDHADGDAAGRDGAAADRPTVSGPGAPPASASDAPTTPPSARGGR